MRVLIVEGGVTGHWLYFVRRLVDEATRTQANCFVALNPAAIKSDEFALHLGDVVQKFELVELRQFDTGWIADAARQIQADLTLVPSADTLTAAFARSGWRAPGRLVLLVLRSRPQVSGDFIRARGRFAVKITALLLLLFRRHVRLRILRSGTLRRHYLLPSAFDPISLNEVSSDAASVEGWTPEEHETWFALLGAISARKNPDLVLQAFVEATKTRTNLALLIAGKVQPEYIPLIDAAAQVLGGNARIVVINRVLTDTEFDNVVSSVHCVVLAYTNEGPSGVLAKAVVAGTHVLTAGSRVLKQEAKANPRIVHWAKANRASIVAQMLRVANLEQPRPGKLAALPEDFERSLFSTDHYPRSVATRQAQN